METFAVNIFCSLLGFFTYLLSGHILTNRESRFARTDALITGGCFLLYFLPELLGSTYMINVVKSFIVYFLLLKLVFYIDAWKSLFMGMIFVLITNIADIITTAVLTSAFKTIYSSGYNDTQIMNTGMMINTVLVIGIAVLFSLLMRNKPYNISFKSKLFMLLCSFMSSVIMLIFDILLTSVEAKSIYLMILLTTVMVYLNVALFQFLESFFYKAELDVIKQQEQANLENYTLLSESQENIRMLRHDMKNHIKIVSDYLENNEIEKAKHYMSKISDTIEGNSFIYTKNQVMDALLNIKGRIAKNLGIHYYVKAAIATTVNIEPMDLSTILGNALDNAIEGAQNTEDKYIIVTVECTDSRLNIAVNNSSPPRDMENDTPATTKQDKENHGLGIKSMRKAAAKYGGSVSPEYKNGNFSVSISLKNGASRRR